MTPERKRPGTRGAEPARPRELRILRWALRALSSLAPSELRDRWLREWEGELGSWWAGNGGGSKPSREPFSSRTKQVSDRNRRGPHHRPSSTLHLRLMWRLLVAARDALHLRIIRRSFTAGRSGGGHRRIRPMLNPVYQDIRSSLRTVRKSPWFSLVTVLTLALGIGTSVAMFGILNAVFLRPLPFPDAERLVVGRATVRGELNPWVAGGDYYDYRDDSDAFEELAAILPFPVEMTISGRGEAERVVANVASPNLFPALQVPPALGRTFQPRDGLEGADAVVLLSHGYWAGQLGGDPGAVGTTLNLDGIPHTIVGALPQDFFFVTAADLWLPMRPDQYAAASRGNHNWNLVGRMKADVSLEQAQASVDVVSARLQDAYPQTNTDKALLLTGLHRVLTEDYHLSLWLLSGAVALILLIACGNGAGILLARAPGRQFELSVRGAMGAPRGRLVRQLLAESLTLSLAAGVLGTMVAIWFQGVMLRYLSMERLGLEDPGISIPSLAAALAVSILSGLLAGLYPALRSARVSVTEGLKTGNRGVGDGGAGFRSGLVATQVALSVVLLAGSGLLIRSLMNLQSLDAGFDAQDILTAEVEIPRARYPDAPERDRFFSDLLGKLELLPGVEAVALTSHLPLGDLGNIYRANAQGREAEPVRIFLRSVSPGYFDVLDIPLLSGRDVEAGDGPGSPWVVILSKTAAQRLFPDEDPLGKVVELPFAPNPRPAEVVGVVGEVRLSRLEEEPEAAVYVPYAHHPRTAVRFALQTRVPRGTLARGVRETLRGLDPEVPLSRVATLESLVADSMSERKVVTLSLTFLALLPLLLASVGLYAVLAYHVSRRRHEIGVRMALGAGFSHLGGLVLRQGLGLVTVGVVLGLGGALAATRLLQNLLFGVGVFDPLTLVGVTALVLAVALAACGVPVWRVTRSDPRAALQAE